MTLKKDIMVENIMVDEKFIKDNDCIERLIFECKAPIVPKGPFSREYTPDFPFPSQVYINHVGGELKRTYRFEESLLRMNMNRFDSYRHPRPDEFYRLLLRYFKEELSDEQATIIEDLKVPLDTSIGDQLFYGEFLSAAIEMEGELIRFYIDPQGLVLEKHTAGEAISYSHSKGSKFTCAEILEFKVKTKKITDGILIEEIDGLSEYLFGCPVEKLPITLKAGQSKIHIFPSDTLAPLGFGTGTNNPDGFFDMVTYYKRGSRGVLKRKIYVRDTSQSERRYSSW